MDTEGDGLVLRRDGLAQSERPENQERILTQLISHEIQHYIAEKEWWDTGSNIHNEINAVLSER